MTRAYVPLLLTLALVWGASYLFIKVAVEEIEPTTMMALRVVIASALLVPFLLATTGVRRGLAELRGATVPGLVLGFSNGALPFTLIAWGEKHVDSGIAAVANATVPLFVAVLAIRYRPSERAGGTKLVGIVLGFVGVVALTGGQPDVDRWAVAGTLAVVVASLSYAASGLYGQGRASETSGLVLATASMLGAALILIPFGILQAPGDLPGWKALGSVAVLGVLGTAFAQLVLFRMWRFHGAARMSLVTYLLPVTALFLGALVLDEAITAGVLVGLGLILAGVALGSGALKLPRLAASAAPHG